MHCRLHLGRGATSSAEAAFASAGEECANLGCSLTAPPSTRCASPRRLTQLGACLERSSFP
eukprot:1963445-Pyramimonas_sp.AAC.1